MCHYVKWCFPDSYYTEHHYLIVCNAKLVSLISDIMLSYAWFRVVRWSVIILSVIILLSAMLSKACRYAKCHYTERH